ncbi:MAG: hypothetical protein QM785_13615 [Pyrinomonadaceae bacterium]
MKMNNLEYISTEYALLDRKGEIYFENEGENRCQLNTEVIMLKQGKIVFSGRDDDLRATEDEYIKRFLRGK